jgi:hypothetical protein
MQIDHPTGHAEGDRIASGDVGRTPYAMAQEGLSELISASVRAQRIEAMNAAMRVDLIVLTVNYAMRSEEAFVAPSLSRERRHEMVHRSVVAELATALHIPERTMERQVSEAWALSTGLPATLGALRSGDITLQHARVIVEETAGLDDEVGTRARLDDRLATAAGTMTAATLRRAARALREELLVETLAERHHAAWAKRRVELEPTHDGMTWLHALLPAVDAALIKNRLDQVARAAIDADARAAGDTRSGHDLLVGHDHDHGVEHLRADAARDLLLCGTLPAESRFAEAVSTVRPTVHVTVPVLSLAGASEEPALLDGYGPIDADTARRLSAHAPSFTRILTHPVSGTVLDVDRNSYRPPADLRRWLQVRDGNCRFPGCNRHAAGCEVDHTIDWDDDGRTAFDNLAHLCSLHHHLKHETSWSVAHRPDGILEWTSPAGRLHVTRPAGRFPQSVDSGRPPDKNTSPHNAASAPPDAAEVARSPAHPSLELAVAAPF